jgi:hypothetical protein
MCGSARPEKLNVPQSCGLKNHRESNLTSWGTWLRWRTQETASNGRQRKSALRQWTVLLAMLGSLLVLAAKAAAQSIPGSTVNGQAKDDITLNVAPPNPNAYDCSPRGLQPLLLTNHGQKIIDLKVSHQFYVTPSGPPVPDPPPAPSVTPQGIVFPSGPAFSPGCTTYWNGDYTNPIYYVIVYTITATYHSDPSPSPGGNNCADGDDTCCPGLTPKLSFGPPPSGAPPHWVPNGFYQLRNQMQFSGPQRPICLDVRLDSESNPGRLQQLDCWRVPGEHLYLNRVENNFYTISEGTAGGRVLIPRSDNQGGESEILGLGMNQVRPAGCTYRFMKTRWALQEDGNAPNIYRIINAATGNAIQVDGSNLNPEGVVDTLDLRGTKEEGWNFDAWGRKWIMAGQQRFFIWVGAVVFVLAVAAALLLRRRLVRFTGKNVEQ